jgi:hypothetical protein
MKRKVFPPAIAICAVVLAGIPYAQAEIIRESATPGDGSAESSLRVGFFNEDRGAFHLGLRFQLGTEVQVDSVGGRFSQGQGTLFATIVSLTDLTALPSGNPFDSSTLATMVFTPPSRVEFADIQVPLSVRLVPGSYALIFGSEYFGANGHANMPLNNPAVVAQESLVTWGIDELPWRPFGLPPSSYLPRLAIEGTFVPEPAAAMIAVMLTAKLSAAGLKR